MSETLDIFVLIASIFIAPLSGYLIGWLFLKFDNSRQSVFSPNLPTPAPGRTGVGAFYYENDVPVMETLTLNLAMPCLTANHRLRGGLRRRAKRLAVRSSLTVTHPHSVAGQDIATSNITSPRTGATLDSGAKNQK